MSRVEYLIKIFLCYNLTNIVYKGVFVTKEQFNQRLKILNLSFKLKPLHFLLNNLMP